MSIFNNRKAEVPQASKTVSLVKEYGRGAFQLDILTRFMTSADLHAMNKLYVASMKKLGSGKAELTDHEKLVVDYAKNNPQAGISTVAKHFGLSERAYLRIFSKIILKR